MWVLENDGDALNGKRLWLRPGKRFLFGRTASEAGGFAINNKTISRKHLVVEINDVQPGDGARPEVRSKLFLEDLNTKIGTLVNGRQIRGTKFLFENNDVFEVKLGHYEHLFRFTWVPVVLSFSFTKSELRNNSIVPLCEQLEVFDIKVSTSYMHGETTHVVARKRNTPKGLQALINGKYIVDHTFIEAIIAAAESEGGDGSHLEKDYDSYWPDALKYLPPRGAEPTERPQEAYGPDPSRHDIFDGYTFIFYDKGQFENLLAPITNGRGKALLHEVEHDVTTVDDFVRYVKNVAGEKGLGEFEDGSEGKGVVVVRYIPQKGATVEWYSDFMRQVSLHLDHRSIEQSEFLDAILNKNASMLRKPLELEASAANTQGETAPPSSIPAEIPKPSAPAPRPVGRLRRGITSRFKGFDDDLDIKLKIIPEPSPPRAQTPPEVGLFVSQTENMEIDQEESSSQLPQLHARRKRPSPPTVPDSEEEDIMEALAPAAARIKRRRMEESAARHQRGEATPQPAAATEPIKQEITPAVKLKKKSAVDIDILEHARVQREKAEERARADREALQHGLDGMDISQIRNLAIIKEMPVERTVPPPNRVAHSDDSERWDERWNGRKNFKKFRRRGDTAPARGIMRVIVPLEEAKRKDFGIGDDYWLGSATTDKESNQSRKGKKNTGRAREVSTTLLTISSQETSQSRSRPPGRRTQTRIADVESSNEPATIELDDDDDDDDDDDVVDVSSTRDPTPSSTAPASSTRSTRASVLTGESVIMSSSRSKRQATTDLSNPGGVKKARGMIPAPRQQKGRAGDVEDDDDDDDDDEGLGFRFKR